ncbi:hypothetical protein RoseRS_0186 [Roseiflexus sp. RS-1]|nr:hypothetical protein RoseRS_0186 [Roseiflexus sp. RS-1]
MGDAQAVEAAPRQRGFVRSARAFTSARAWRALMHAHAAEPAPPPRPTLKRRADGTTGAAAPARWGMRRRWKQPRAPPDAHGL